MDHLKLLARYMDVQQANLDKSLLEDCGIECYLFDEFTAGAMQYTFAVGGIRLMVAAHKLEEAIKILKEAGTTVELPEIKRCNHCGSSDIGNEKVSGWWHMFMALFLGVFTVRENRVMRCHSCGQEVEMAEHEHPA